MGEVIYLNRSHKYFIGDVPVDKPNTAKDYLSLLNQFLDEDLYIQVLCGITDEDIYKELHPKLRKLVDYYLWFLNK